MELTKEEIEEQIFKLREQIADLASLRHTQIEKETKEQIMAALTDALTKDFEGHHLGNDFELQTESYIIEVTLKRIRPSLEVGMY